MVSIRGIQSTNKKKMQGSQMCWIYQPLMISKEIPFQVNIDSVFTYYWKHANFTFACTPTFWVTLEIKWNQLIGNEWTDYIWFAITAKLYLKKKKKSCMCGACVTKKKSLCLEAGKMFHFHFKLQLFSGVVVLKESEIRQGKVENNKTKSQPWTEWIFFAVCSIW